MNAARPMPLDDQIATFRPLVFVNVSRSANQANKMVELECHTIYLVGPKVSEDVKLLKLLEVSR